MTTTILLTLIDVTFFLTVTIAVIRNRHTPNVARVKTIGLRTAFHNALMHTNVKKTRTSKVRVADVLGL